MEKTYLVNGQEIKVQDYKVSGDTLTFSYKGKTYSYSVVTKDIPDYCVAVGSPAVVIKRYNFETKQWCKTDKEGQII